MKNIFADKATLVLRKMINDPGKKWVVRDFVGPDGLSIGMAQEVLEAMEKRGYTERVKRGPESFSLLTNRERLIKDWVEKYQFEMNEIDSYYSSEKNILKKIKTNLKESQYALALHTGANLITHFVRTDHVYIYLDSKTWDNDILKIRQKLELKELVRGGNIHFVSPYYKKSIFTYSQRINGYRVVSHLQLYLDLYYFQPRGRAHADYLKSILEERGIHLV